jgi:hypothetical protein
MSRNTSGTSSQQAEIPDFLKPYFSAQAGTGLSALQNLQGQLQNAGADQLVAGFTPTQLQGQQMAIDYATDPNGNLAFAQNRLQDIAKGAAIDRYSPMVLDSMTAGMNAPNLPGVDTSMLQGFAQGGLQIDPVSQQALAQSAQGGFMYGNPAFDEAVQASMRAARPSILSGFAAQGGAGAAKSGLAQIGIQQAASDSFARLFGDERNRQLAATNQIGDFRLGARNLQQDAATQQTQAQLSQRGQDVQQQQLRNQMASAFGGLLSDERGRQLNAAGQLPGVGLFGANILQGVGDQQQQLAQSRLTAPMSAQQMLLAASAGMPQFNSLIGQSGTMSESMTGKETSPIYRNKGAGALGGALTGAQLGSMFGPMGTGIGAVGGGLLGLLG